MREKITDAHYGSENQTKKNESLQHFFISVTMVIKRSLGEESAGGNRSASEMTNCSAGLNCDLGNASFWIKIRDAKFVDQCRCRTTSSTAVELHPRRPAVDCFSFSKLFSIFFYHQDQTISKSSWRICSWRSIDQRPTCLGVNFDLGNGSFWIEIRDAKHVDRCR